MNPLLEQFLSESRELLEKCCDTFLELENAPSDNQLLNNLFRYVHTIKGGSGLFEIEPYTRLLHVTEDSLSKARDGHLHISSEGIDLYLKIVDQLDAWLNELEAEQTLNQDASAVSDQLVNQIRTDILGDDQLADDNDSQAEQQPAAAQPSTDELISQFKLNGLRADLLGELRTRLDNLDSPLSLVVYRPEQNAFFCGDDPVSYWLQIPGLSWQGIDAEFPEQDINEFDPYGCHLTLVGLFDADEASLKESLNYVWHSIEMISLLPTPPANVGGASVSNEEAVRLQQVLFSQSRILHSLSDNPHPQSSLNSVQRVLSSLHSSLPELSQLEDIKTPEGLVNPDFLEGLERLIDTLCAQSDPAVLPSVSASEPEQLADPDSSKKADLVNQGSVRNETKIDGPKTVKVDQEKLEQLVDLTGELIVAKNSLQHLSRRVEQEYGIKALSRDLKNEHAVLNRITESLQDVVMEVRMIPISTIFQRFPRLVRDLSRRLGKKIDLQVSGEETAADKNIVEQLADPLIHLVRNSIDHGIEMPDVRHQTGKTETGVIRLEAKTVEDSVQIEIHDDGAGIDPQKIKAKAIAKGVITEEVAATLSKDEILHLIFEPGFSTCEQVSDLSGRGVGMDVVKTTVSRIGGSIDLQSETGKGSVIRVTLPASITVSRVMMFEVNEQVYGIPVEGLSETIKIRPEQIRYIKQRESYVLRNKLIPLYRMHQLLGLRQCDEQEELPILNLNIGGTMAGFAVDRLLEGVDVIIKPMEGVMSRFPLYSGAAVLGDGRVLLVINPKEMPLCH